MALLEALGGFGQGFSGAFPDTFKTVLQNIMQRRQLLETGQLEAGRQENLARLQSGLRTKEEAAKPLSSDEIMGQLMVKKHTKGITPEEEVTLNQLIAMKTAPLNALAGQIKLGEKQPGGPGVAGAGVGGVGQSTSPGILGRINQAAPGPDLGDVGGFFSPSPEERTYDIRRSRKKQGFAKPEISLARAQEIVASLRAKGASVEEIRQSLREESFPEVFINGLLKITPARHQR